MPGGQAPSQDHDHGAAAAAADREPIAGRAFWFLCRRCDTVTPAAGGSSGNNAKETPAWMH
jgi:hypothetical protein